MNSRLLEQVAGTDNARPIHIGFMEDSDAYRVKIGEQVCEGLSLEEMDWLTNAVQNWWPQSETPPDTSEGVRVVPVKEHEDVVGWTLHFPTAAGQDTAITINEDEALALNYQWAGILSGYTVRRESAPDTGNVDWQRDGF